MRNNPAISFVLLLLAAGMFACKKDTAKEPTGSFQPTGSGSTWNYSVTGTSSGTFTLTATSRDTTINGRPYRVFTNSAGPNEYYLQSGSDYFRFSSLAELNNQVVELLYLKTNLSVGQTWVEVKTVNATITGLGTQPVTATLTFTVAEKGIRHTVNGVTYNDVIRIDVTPSFSLMASAIPVNSSNIRYYYARNVGMIQSFNALRIDVAGINTNTETRLTSYTIR
ncbi:MAG: hypothetical protein ACK4E8_09510 [Lacibacter sp.]|jgi:hypothetical protein